MGHILLIGDKTDPHISGIKKELEKINQKCIILDKFSNHDFFDVYFDGKTKSKIEFQNQEILNKNIQSIWNTSALKISFDQEIVGESKKFVDAEWTEGITTLWNSIDTKWVNEPSSMFNAVNRVKQLKLANDVGLTSPKTLVTNNPDKFKTFFEQCNEEMIAKTLHSSEGLPKGKMIFTTKISKEDLDRSEELSFAPCLFQEYIPKKTELRVTIIGDKIHATEIHSQKSEKTRHDWRHYDDFSKTPYVSVDLPDDISEKLLKLMGSMELKFGAADLIKTPNDEYYFLEVNPNGRWWWIQELTQINIAKDIASYLAEP